jgi:uncharacterized protein YbaA (DUF1428 family)
MTYIMGFVIAVPTANKEAYREMADAAAAVFKKHGALSVVEAWGADVPEADQLPDGSKAGARRDSGFFLDRLALKRGSRRWQHGRHE